MDWKKLIEEMRTGEVNATGKRSSRGAALFELAPPGKRNPNLGDLVGHSLSPANAGPGGRGFQNARAYEVWLVQQAEQNPEVARLLKDSYVMNGLKEALRRVREGGDFARAVEVAQARVGQLQCQRREADREGVRRGKVRQGEYADEREQRRVVEQLYQAALRDQPWTFWSEELRKASEGKGGEKAFLRVGWDPKEMGPDLVKRLARQVMVRLNRETGFPGGAGGRVEAGSVKMPFGKFEGKRLDELPDYYIAFLHGVRGSENIHGSLFGHYLERFFEHPWVQAVIRDYSEDHERSTPRDLQPYHNPYDPKTWDTDLYWREFRNEGFATSDPWEAARLGTSQEFTGPESSFESIHKKLETRRTAFRASYQTHVHYKHRRQEFRFQEEFDPEYYDSQNLAEHLDVMQGPRGGFYKRMGAKLEPLTRAFPDTMVPYTARRYDEGTRQWVDEVKYRQRFGYVRWKLHEAMQDVAQRQFAAEGQPGSRQEAEAWAREAQKSERVQRDWNRLMNPGGAAGAEAADWRGPRAGGRRRKGLQYPDEEDGLGKQPPYLEMIGNAPDLQELQRVAEELEDKYGLRNIRLEGTEEWSPIDVAIRERMGALIKDRAAGLAGGSPG